MSNRNDYQDFETQMRFPSKAARDATILRLSDEGATVKDLAMRFKLRTDTTARIIETGRNRKDRGSQDFGLNTRSLNCLEQHFFPCPFQHGKLTIDLIATLDFGALKEIPNLGAASILEIVTMLWQRGIVTPGLPKKLRLAFEGGDGAIAVATPSRCIYENIA